MTPTRCCLPLCDIYRPGRLYFERDGGLICRHLAGQGWDAQLLLFGSGSGDGDPQMQLAAWPEWTDADWWRSQRLAFVVAYSWGNPKYADAIHAVRRAGIPVMVKFDSDGLVSARIDPAAFWIENFGNYLERHTAVPVAAALSSAKVAYHVGLPLRDIRLVRGFEPADVLAIESPMAADRLKKYLVRLGRSDLASRVAFVPHPVKEAFAPGDDARRPVHIVAAGRWDSYAKDASLMVRTLALALRASPGFTAVIAGTGETIVRDLVERHARDVADRIDVRGFVEHDAMPGVLRQARVLLVTSRWETFHIAAAEAVCCGCSVVAPASIPSMNHFVSKQSGRLAATRKPEVFAAAVLEELSDWDGGKRNPATIAAAWQKELHVGAVARRMTELLGVA